jgi:hypothetical protein
MSYRILARDTSGIMMPSSASPEMAALLGISEEELDKPSHAFTVLRLADFVVGLDPGISCGW